MKKTIKYFIALCCLPFLNSCLEETHPTWAILYEQMKEDENSLVAQSNAIAASMTHAGDDYGDYFGYGSMMIWHDVMVADLPIFSSSYDYYSWYGRKTARLDDVTTNADFWDFYYNLIHNANQLIGLVNPETATPEALAYLGNALAYRSFAYFDLARMYEYKHTGVAALDAQAESNQIMKLTVPIITENTTEEEARNNPRAPFYKMYRFLMDDLNRAEIYLKDYERDAVNYADVSVVYGLKARLWLELGTRFEKYPEDLSTQLSHESDAELQEFSTLGINSAADCFDRAASYARLAINEGYSPITESEWHNTKTGFNTANNAWMWGILIGSEDDAVIEWQCFTGMLCPETIFGVSCPTYGAMRMIDASLFAKIPDTDWRKKTWIAPSDAGQTSAASKYNTLLKADEWADLPAYTGLKFRPGNGNTTNYLEGTVVDIPLMRVEEMYLIEAEAKAHISLQAGVSALNQFVKTYRDSGYSYSASDINEFCSEILKQKRIEFWGEGIVLWDYKRLEKAVIRQYDGSNFPSAYQLNSPEGYVARWLNIYITSEEYQYNTALVNNPNPSYNSAYEY